MLIYIHNGISGGPVTGKKDDNCFEIHQVALLITPSGWFHVFC